MKRRLAISWIGLASSALAVAQQDDRELLAGAADRLAHQAVKVTAVAADAESSARAEVALATARLELVLARKALGQGQAGEAAARAQRAQAAIKGLPESDAVAEVSLQAEGILARVGRANAPILASDAPASSAAATEPVVAEAASGATGPEPLDTDVIRERDLRRLERDAALRERFKSDEARLLSEADETRVVPYNEIDYPRDWPERMARRDEQSKDYLARTRSVTDAQGREWHAAVYDISDLTYEPPDFHPASSLFGDENLRDALDREALRQRSQIFGGYAEDLAAGIPLLRFFGGVDDYEFRGSKFSSDRHRQIAAMVDAFMQRMNEPKVISVP